MLTNLCKVKAFCKQIAKPPLVTDKTLASKKNLCIGTFKVSSFLVDASKRLSLYGLISLMQEMAWTHAGILGYGYASIRRGGGSWVIARQRIIMEEWPAWESELTIRTWLRPPGSVIVVRDFEFLSSGRRVGQAAAHWLTIHHENRRPQRLPFSDDPTQFRDSGHLDFEPQQLPEVGPVQELARFTVRYSDLDMNGHVNNVRFAQWILDSLDPKFHARHLAEYQINFLAEARPGDELVVSAETSTHPLSFQAQRAADEQLLLRASLAVR